MRPDWAVCAAGYTPPAMQKVRNSAGLAHIFTSIIESRESMRKTILWAALSSPQARRQCSKRTEATAARTAAILETDARKMRVLNKALPGPSVQGRITTRRPPVLTPLV